MTDAEDVDVPLFKPFRALGYITDDVPFAVTRRGKETYVVVSVGKTWQVYNCAKLTLVLVGPQMGGSIRALASKGDIVWSAVGEDVVECKRVHRSGTYRSPPGSGPISQLLNLGEQLLVLHEGGRLAVWTEGDYSAPQRVLECGSWWRGGGAGGEMQLWNYQSGQRLHTFTGWGSAIRVLTASPALDVMGVGLADGRVVLHHLKFDEEVACFRNAAGAGLAAGAMLGGGAGKAGSTGGGGGVAGEAVTALSFKNGPGLSLMAAGGGCGVVTIWELGQKKLHTVLRDAHDGRLLGLHWFTGEPRLMSSAADNSLKQWLFDATDGTARLLRFRSGHSAPPAVVSHYGEGLRLLSAGADRAFRVFSTIQDQQSRELSQGHMARKAKKLKVTQGEVKLPKVVGMDACETRERDWCNVITAHDSDSAAYTWKLQDFTLGEKVLRPPPPPHADSRVAPGAASPASPAWLAPPAPVTSVALSRCGNFGVVGSASGRVDRYNMQSGIHRGCYWRLGDEATGAVGGVRKRQGGPAVVGGGVIAHAAHQGPDVSRGMDSSNVLMVTSEIALGGPACALSMHPTSTLAAVALGGGAAGGSSVSHSIKVFDVEAPRLVRRFVGHSDRVTGLHMSADSRWLLSASMDGTLRVWDVPASNCIQVLQLGAPVTSLSLSPSQDMLATTHINRRGIYLWSNQAIFGDARAIASCSDGRVIRCALPSVSTGNDDDSSHQHHHNGSSSPASDASESSRHDINSEEDEDVEDEQAEAEARRIRRIAKQATQNTGVEARAPYEAVDSVTGAPCPMGSQMVTLSLLPRSQWESLANLEAIKARNQPLAPPTKPEAAPFFLPTVPGLSSQPVFDLIGQAASFFEGGSSSAAASDSADGGGSSGSDPKSKKSAAGGSKSRVLTTKPNAPDSVTASQFLVLLRQGAVAVAAAAAAAPKPVLGAKAVAAAATGSSSSEVEAVADPWAPFLKLIRGLTPTALDRELRSMQVLEGGDEREIEDLASLLRCLHSTIAAGADFEFCQALLQLTLQVHGDSITAHASLRDPAAVLLNQLRSTWRRLDPLLQHVRCMVAYFGQLQG
ncbi:MAG: hypothetical protein WDW38_009286 [Sanguina aurantia]